MEMTKQFVVKHIDLEFGDVTLFQQAPFYTRIAKFLIVHETGSGDIYTSKPFRATDKAADAKFFEVAAQFDPRKRSAAKIAKEWGR